jgi:hypothetical protein
MSETLLGGMHALKVNPGSVAMTEEEAKKKWCPHTRITSQAVDLRNGSVAFLAVNRVITAQGASLAQGTDCIGSMCMSWRETGESRDGKALGYCGLSGKP